MNEGINNLMIAYVSKDRFGYYYNDSNNMLLTLLINLFIIILKIRIFFNQKLQKYCFFNQKYFLILIYFSAQVQYPSINSLILFAHFIYLQSLMQVPKPSSRLLQSTLRGIPQTTILNLSQKIYPFHTSPHSYQCLYNNMQTFARVRIAKGMSMDAISKEMLKTVQPFMVQKQLKQKFDIDLINIIIAPLKQNSQSKSQNQQQNTKISNNANTNNNSVAPTVFDYRDHKNNPRYNEYMAQNNFILNLAQKNICLCGKQCQPIQGGIPETYKCIHCEHYYHRMCMQRTRNCIYCFMKLMYPTQHVVSQLFVGHLRKDRKKHQMFFDIQNFISSKEVKYSYQIRCIRLTETTQNFNLFPDYVSINLNNHPIKEFQPLHKQSSLKYRRDQVYNIAPVFLKKSNKIVLQQKQPATKDDRVDSESHVIAIYEIKNKTVQQVVSEYMDFYLCQFEMSKKLLERSFNVSSQQISCQVSTVSLQCSYSRTTIKYPARGLFCQHFTCFDLQSFVSFISKSTPQKWNCPVCKIPAYSFYIDPILLQIIRRQQGKEITHALFKASGQFQVYNNKKVIPQQVKTIHQLSFQHKMKRDRPQMDTEQTGDTKVQKKKAKKNSEIPTDAQIISLDDD